MSKQYDNCDPTPLPGTLTLVTDTNVKELSISYTIPIQTMYLRGYRLQLLSAANAEAEKILYIELPIFNTSKMIDANPGVTLLPIMLDNAAVTNYHGLDIPISLGSELPPRFTMRVLNGSFTPVANLVSCGLQFSLSQGSL